MLGSTLSFARRNLLGLIALAFIAIPSSYALAAASAEKTTRVCVDSRTGLLRFVKTPGHCRNGERSFFVSRRGVRGLRGMPGQPGVRGVTGVPGKPGIGGDAGLRGLIGATGAPGIPGSPGTTGSAGANGTNGSNGTIGPPGAQGTPGTAGTNGVAGTPGVAGTNGLPGLAGTNGTAGADGSDGAPGSNGSTGPPGTPGAAGAQGLPGPAGSFQYASFYAIMPSDNAATVASGTDLLLLQNGPRQGSIVRVTPSSFALTTVGTYRVAFGASITEAGQLQLTLDGVGVPSAVFGRATGTGLISGEAFITTTGPGGIVTVRNSSAGVVTLTPFAGGPVPVTAYLTIQQLS